jgi:hypothetical protein
VVLCSRKSITHLSGMALRIPDLRKRYRLWVCKFFTDPMLPPPCIAEGRAHVIYTGDRLVVRTAWQ